MIFDLTQMTDSQILLFDGEKIDCNRGLLLCYPSNCLALKDRKEGITSLLCAEYELSQLSRMPIDTVSS